LRQAVKLDRTLAALADPNRRRVVELLRDRSHTAGELATHVGMSPAALTRHLKTLKSAGLIAESHPDHDARVSVYHLSPAPMADLKDWLARTESLWARQLAAFKVHVERTR
jgi:DNA-binding transcriptional ArsR family regulator